MNENEGFRNKAFFDNCEQEVLTIFLEDPAAYNVNQIKRKIWNKLKTVKFHFKTVKKTVIRLLDLGFLKWREGWLVL